MSALELDPSEMLPKLTLLGLAPPAWTPVPETLKGIGMQVPPAIGHSKTFVVPDDEVAEVGRKDCLTLQVPGPVKPPPAPQVSKSKLNGTLIPLPEASCVA